MNLLRSPEVGALLLAIGIPACAIAPPHATEAPAVGATALESQAAAAASGAVPPARMTDAPSPTDVPDVWVDEPPLGPLPEGPSARAKTSRAAVVGYLRAAHTVGAADARIRHRRHHPWMHPTAPGRTGGLWTPDPPDVGVTRRVEILEMELVASAPRGAAWLTTYRLWDGPTMHAQRTRHVATRQVDDGHWLVIAETIDLQPVAH